MSATCSTIRIDRDVRLPEQWQEEDPSMQIFDSKFTQNKLWYLLQCLLATVSVLLVLLALDTISNTAITAALGASCFIVFTMPHAQVSRPRVLIGGYVVGLGAGTLCYFLSQLNWPASLFAMEQSHLVFGALAVGLAIFVMVVTNTEHPPAASLALGLVLGKWAPVAIVVILVGIVALVLLKCLIKPILKDLL